MAKLVVLSEGMTGQSYELKVDRTTIGRVEDNTFPIPQPSVSSHHCEIYLRGNDVVVKDLNSTNGTFINNQQITGESVLKPGQILRLGQVEMRLDAPGASASTDCVPAATAAAAVCGQAADGFDHGDFQRREPGATGTGTAGRIRHDEGRVFQEDQQDEQIFHHRRDCLRR